METVKEKLEYLIIEAVELYPSEYETLLDHLIQNGVTILECGMDCKSCWKTKIVNPVQGWVSVDEPPKEDGRYLVFSEYEEGTGMADALYEKDRGEFGDYAWYWTEARGEYKVWVEFKYVTYWMPLPALPKGER